MRTEIIISGYGGQGAMLAGNILCQAALYDDKYVTFFPSYGAEMRGGTANCQVVISDQVIGSPIIYHPDILIAFNKPAFDKFKSKLKGVSLIIANADLFAPEDSDDYKLIKVPGNSLAEKCGDLRALNTVSLGVLAASTKLISVENCCKAIEKIMGEKKKKLWAMNQSAVNSGFEFYNTNSSTH